ncbi:PREDICTED: uncharacterized protein LOC104590021 [Nelumbo nucifera]|uniref:Uncharacterized protein LOC104590021 n=2 Tax=Nelumbo nucifera TaxID=4432 RepID=A0A1U7Z3T0_NELNU|nr:PREDICTED: uncharacterized protein LOC104590021 [Nelumbo nucifera]XP_010246828.1 PREDICTED: uncharacterized protein LOC104590021 [Nelumbo nucifera]XP_010246829.1 PREDICTED: uncharacterized protein LOC104590021 [Nelumbo nucifera]DAD41639.1 TPA_asm: hypothetical protein HUJ06_015962 [Nelumbo nucifera]
MTLEDFFTLTEMKDGLTAPARVEELVSMIKENDLPGKNVREAARQWCTVASTLAATENKDCLNRFIHLDGLHFLNQWLHEVQKFSNDKSDSSAEESVTALLGALEKLPIDKEKSVSSGIGVTVNHLFSHHSFKVQDRARALIDGWNQGRQNEASNKDAEKNEACLNDNVSPSGEIAVESGCLEQTVLNVTPFRGYADEDNHIVEPSGRESQLSRSSDSSHSQSLKDIKLPMSGNQGISQNSSPLEGDELPGDALGSSVMEDSSLPRADGTISPGACTSPGPVEVDVRKSLDVSELKGFTDDKKEIDIPDDLGKDVSSVSASLGPEYVSSTDAAAAQKSVVELSVPTGFDAKEMKLCPKKISPTTSTCLDSDVVTLSEPKRGLVDCGVVKHSRSTMDIKSRGQAGECISNVSEDLSGNGYISRKTEGSQISFCRKEDIDPTKDLKDFSGESSLKVGKGEELALHADVSQQTIDADVSRQTIDTEGSDKVDKRKSEMDLEYGVDDALEVARQVAKEVEQEVVDYREPLCSSSSENNSEGGVVQHSSLDSINGEQDQSTMGPQNEVPTGQNLCAVASSPNGREHLICSDNGDRKSEDCMQDMEISQVTEAAQEPNSTTEKDIYEFDLNKEVCSEEMDRPMTPISAPKPIVAASKAAITAGMSVAPLHFEGALGWKGSAATSAFRPPSPRRTLDGEKTPSVEGSSYSSKQRQDVLDIDLNVAEVDDEGVTDTALMKQMPVSSGLLSGESSTEVSSKRAERLKLDLNRVDENEDAPSSDWRMDEKSPYHHCNGNQSPSPSSASSSRQPSMRNIDLNDSFSVFDDSHDRRAEMKSTSQGMNDPVISIMGTKVEVNRKEFLPPSQSFLPNGQVAEYVMGTNSASLGSGIAAYPVMTYTHAPPVFSYNGLTVGPSVSLSPAMYGPGSVPYMVDSRGNPVAPQVVGSPVPGPSYSQPSFIMNMPGPPSGLNGVGPSHSSLDLNSGLTTVEGENRELGGSRQLFIQGQSRSDEEQIKPASWSLSSGMAVRRKEPDGGRDSYPSGNKQQRP